VISDGHYRYGQFQSIDRPALKIGRDVRLAYHGSHFVGTNQADQPIVEKEINMWSIMPAWLSWLPRAIVHKAAA